MVLAVELVRKRLLKVSSALDAAGLPYAVVGGNAVAAWVATIDVAAVRNTQDVDILLERSDLPAAIAALEHSGFFYRHSAEPVFGWTCFESSRHRPRGACRGKGPA